MLSISWFFFFLFFLVETATFCYLLQGPPAPVGLAATLLMMQNLDLNVNFFSLSLCALHLELLEGH
jgi:hypothetical protein